MRIALTTVAVLSAAWFVVNAGATAKEPATTDAEGKKHVIFTNDAGQAVSGYDPVAYFTDGQPTKGSNDYTLDWRGAKWRFASAENKAAFAKEPEKYAPAYGGYCAWGVAAKSDLFPTDPKAWKIEDGRLFLNYNADVQKTWLKDPEGFIEKGDRVWPDLQATNSGS